MNTYESIHMSVFLNNEDFSLLKKKIRTKAELKTRDCGETYEVLHLKVGSTELTFFSRGVPL